MNTAIGCTSCLPGYICPGGCADPSPCGVGLYSSQYGAITCTSCTAGTYNVLTAATNCVTCPAGYSCSSTTAGKK